MLAAGAGTRLRPLTDVLPKPLAPVGGRPVVKGVLERLEAAGAGEVALNLHHGAELVERVVGPGPHYLRESWLRGTAGALAGAADFLRGGHFVVASSDGAHEVDVAALMRRHRDAHAAATITVKRIDHPETCAIVRLDERDLVQRFVEKPPPEAVFSDLASIGIYCFAPEVLDLIPTDRPYDIAGELIPALLDHGFPVAAYRSDAYWSDIGTPEQLLAANLRVGFIADGCELAPDATVDAPVMIGPDARVGSGAVVRESLVLPGAEVARGERLERGIAGNGADVVRTWLARAR